MNLRTRAASFASEHLLAQSMIDNGLYDEGYLVTIAPALNYHVQDSTDAYHAQLREPVDGKVRFVNLTLEDVIETIQLSDPAHAEARAARQRPGRHRRPHHPQSQICDPALLGLLRKAILIGVRQAYYL